MSFYPSNKDDEALLARFLLTCSQMSLGDFFLKRLDHDRQLRKDLARLIDLLIENMAMVRLAEFLRDHRDEIAALASLSVPQKSMPQLQRKGERKR